ncbi:DoxX family protein [Pseudoteredinibacter isoporae]|uniref:Putative oxidoreductase n=1 Tax=Pseudoteredinibacter isoporae TaxID=570281 RepID=A0A7X0JU08_9GAMM|nr:DoxX family protein [Pseudoteredinibacter isoporae]MBB6522252.1 putative oxidoreductase [Pseudoteredinibacter isoporae]NHO87786.1 DoxX family protein [Pseudoteredinibacter isoporae]NIB23883.1 DoxX family protein [Pseudoteredinibacter isoporae]
MNAMIQSIYTPYQRIAEKMQLLHPVAALLSRLYIAKVFFVAGWLKIQDWDTTLFLFEEEYQVPFLPFELAAYLGTAGELIFPVLLALGLASRFAALGLTVVNIVAVISLAEIAPAALYLHVIWGVLLAQIVIYGAGFFSADRFLKRHTEASQTHS